MTKAVSSILVSEDDEVYRVFKTFSTKKLVKGSSVANSVIEPGKLKMALSSLGGNHLDDVFATDLSSTQDLDFVKFKTLADEAIRSSLLYSVAKGALLDRSISGFFPGRVEDILNLTEEMIAEILKREAFVTSFSRRMHDIIQNHRKSKRTAAAFESDADSGHDSSTTIDNVVLTRYLGPESALAAMEKYHSSGGFIGNYGDKRLFDGGLEAQIGLADPLLLKAILREHIHSEDSECPFLTTNYGLETTPLLELARLLGTADAAAYLRSAAGRAAAAGSAAAGRPAGPTPQELDELAGDLDRLARAHRLVEASGRGIYPGEPGDEVREAMVHGRIALAAPGGDAEAALDPLAERLAAALMAQELSPLKQSARRVEIAVPPFAEERDVVGVTLAVPLPPLPPDGAKPDAPLLPSGVAERLRDLIARTAGVGPAQVQVELVAEQTFVYCDFADEAGLRRSLARRSPDELRAKAAAARAAAPPRTQLHPRAKLRSAGHDSEQPEACVETVVRAWLRETEEWRRQVPRLGGWEQPHGGWPVPCTVPRVSSAKRAGAALGSCVVAA